MEKKSLGPVQFVVLAFSACLVFAVMQGVHDNYGIMMKALVASSGIAYDRISFVIGVGAVLYGFSQPVWGALAVRKSNTFVMFIGIVLIAAGLFVTPLCRHFATLLLFFGIVLPCGTGALGSGIIMGAVTPIFGERRAASFSGVLQASAGIGDAVMSPSLQSIIGWRGVHYGMGFFAVLILLAVPAVFLISMRNREIRAASAETGTSPAEGLRATLRSAFGNPTYRRIVAGFSTCGFNMSIIEAHLFSQFVSWGIPESKSSFIMTIYGILTMLGAVLTGALSTRLKMKSVLGATYFVRVLISLAMLLFPAKGLVFAIVITALLGMTGDSTVPPTMGLITREFGSARIAVVYGIALAFHQVGAFASSWLGGFCFARFGDYTLLWAVNAALCLFASCASWSIREQRPPL